MVSRSRFEELSRIAGELDDSFSREVSHYSSEHGCGWIEALDACLEDIEKRSQEKAQREEREFNKYKEGKELRTLKDFQEFR